MYTKNNTQKRRDLDMRIRVTKTKYPAQPQASLQAVQRPHLAVFDIIIDTAWHGAKGLLRGPLLKARLEGGGNERERERERERENSS